MDYLEVDGDLPELRKPTFIAVFRGWNDAGESASAALRHLIESWSAEAFAQIDPEEFFDFTVARPMIKISDEGLRDLQWPTNRFYSHRRAGDGEGDVVLMLGTEPHLKWRAFAATVRDLFQRLDGSRLVTMGSLVAATTHTRPIPITGFSTEAELNQRLDGLTINRARYEGPTGIVGALHDTWRRAGLSAASLWAGLPPYLGSATNPQGALSLLETLDRLFPLGADLAALQDASRSFADQVDDALSGNLEMKMYVAELEKRIDAGVSEAATPDLPPAGDIIGELEEYLRGQRQG
ncbi:MAG: PAC2 family protein [Dehalococcoidia bacterium]